MTSKDVLLESRIAHKACLDHSEDLIASARTVLDIGKPNIAYHLATLALEEIGKAGLLFISLQAGSFDRDPAWARNNSRDHVKKLFFAFFGASFGNRVLDKKELESFQGLASKIHDKRKKGLYVDLEEDLSIPQDAISIEESVNLIDLATARLNIEQEHEVSEIPEEEKQILAWFLEASEDPEKKKALLGSKSMEKLAELGSSRDWINWLKDVFDKNEEENRKLAEQELQRKMPEGEETLQEKWKIKIRIYSASHSIRQKVLNSWNNASDWIKLTSVSGAKHRNELILEFTFTKQIPIHQVWWQSWGLARQFVVALNIGSMGYFWWNLPKLTDKFYEKVIDLEENVEISLKRSPSLEFDWGGRAISDNDLANAAMCFAFSPRQGDENAMEPFNAYIGGLTFLGINDLNWQCEIEAFDNFWKCFKAAAQIYGGYSKDHDIFKYMLSLFPEKTSDNSDIEKCCALGIKLENSELKRTDITLENAAYMKILCDVQFLTYFKKMKEERLSQEEKTYK